jgi:Z1 domain
MDSASGQEFGGLDVIRDVTDEDIAALDQGQFAPTLGAAILDFVLAGAARAQRGQGDAPATMLVHTSQLKIVHTQLKNLVDEHFGALRDEWRYQRSHGISVRLAQRWETEFRPVIRASHIDRDVPYKNIEPHIGPFFEAVQVRMLNSDTGEVLDYEREPSLKAIGIGGNKLSRGLTLEGLLVSYYIRRSATYDTLMQMGRWFGFRGGYEDITRIWTTPELAGWFSDLAFVEHRLREDIEVYENQGLTPYEVGMRIWQHPTMQITSPLKRRFASNTTIAQSYSITLEQTFKFPLRRLEDLSVQAEANRIAVQELVADLGVPDGNYHVDAKGPFWTNIDPKKVMDFLDTYRVDNEVRSVSSRLIRAYIERLVVVGELTRWTIAVRGRGKTDSKLGTADWGLPNGYVSQISRSRLGQTDSVGVIVDPEDEALGLDTDKRGREARAERPSEEGLLLLYPISRFSGHDLVQGSNRRRLFDDPDGPLARDLVGLAISFPRSKQSVNLEAYLVGTVGWSPVE